MWVTTKYILLSTVLILLTLSADLNYFKFGVLSELLWLTIYTSISLGGVYVNDPVLHSIPFFILTLTAVEAVIFWSLLLWNTSKG